MFQGDKMKKSKQYDYLLGSWLWVQKTELSAPEIALYGSGDKGIGYYLMLEKKCYQKKISTVSGKRL